MTDINVNVQVVGVKELLAALKSTDKKLVRQTQAAMRDAGSPLVAQARNMTPTTPLSGWGHNGRTGWRDSEVQSGLKVSIGGARMGTSWPLLKLTQKNPAGMIFDWAGRAGMSQRKPRSREYAGRPQGHANTTQGRALIANLPQFGYIKGAKYSRVLFPAFVATRREVTAALLEALDKVAAEMNREIERVG